jgi:hypothetical protein
VQQPQAAYTERNVAYPVYKPYCEPTLHTSTRQAQANNSRDPQNALQSNGGVLCKAKADFRLQQSSFCDVAPANDGTDVAVCDRRSEVLCACVREIPSDASSPAYLNDFERIATVMIVVVVVVMMASVGSNNEDGEESCQH